MWNRDRLLDALTGIALVATILTVGLVAKRELAPPSSAQTLEKPQRVKDWAKYISSGRLAGPQDAPLTLVEFADFQCPACRSLNGLIQKMRQENPGKIAVSYHYAPLPYHPLAYPAARAAECAAAQGKFEPYHNALYETFDTLSPTSFAEIAKKVGIGDLTAFAECANRKDPVLRIDADRALAFDTLRIKGTPTVIVNGFMYPFAPLPAQLKEMVDAAARTASR